MSDLTTTFNLVRSRLDSWALSLFPDKGPLIWSGHFGWCCYFVWPTAGMQSYPQFGSPFAQLNHTIVEQCHSHLLWAIHLMWMY